jgi:hypothetical protein
MGKGWRLTALIAMAVIRTSNAMTASAGEAVARLARPGADQRHVPLRRMALVLWGLTWLGGPATAQVPDPSANRLPGRVAAATITTNGARGDGVSGDETVASCAAFRLRPRDVWHYFAVARIVDARAYHHDLEMSRCHAEGVVRFRNGERGQWSIDRERRCLVVLQDGQPIYLYCPRCTAKVFEPVYDPDHDSPPGRPR